MHCRHGERRSRVDAPGETKARVLAAMSSEHGLTAGEVANTTGLARGTVSTTLSKLSKTGEVVKADRGYRLPSTNGEAANAAGPGATPATADLWTSSQLRRLAVRELPGVRLSLGSETPAALQPDRARGAGKCFDRRSSLRGMLESMLSSPAVSPAR
jgi:hypothetical protein